MQGTMSRIGRRIVGAGAAAAAARALAIVAVAAVGAVAAIAPGCGESRPAKPAEGVAPKDPFSDIQPDEVRLPGEGAERGARGDGEKPLIDKHEK